MKGIESAEIIPFRTDGKFSYRKSPQAYIGKMATHIIPGFALGIAIDKVCTKFQEAYNLKPWLMIIIQLVVMIIVVYISEMVISWTRTQEWQDITPGFFFVSLFFGVQFNLFQNIKTFTRSK